MFCFKYTNVKVLSNNMVNFMMIFFFRETESLYSNATYIGTKEQTR